MEDSKIKRQAEKWTTQDRLHYQEDRTAIDRMVIFTLCKELIAKGDCCYESPGVMASDYILRAIHYTPPIMGKNKKR